MLPTTRFGGHIVSGHIDTTGVIQKIAQDSRSIYFEIQIPADFAKYVATKGSITVDGISLTSNLVQGNIVSLNIIPHTAQVTNIGRHWKVGSKVNIEDEALAKRIVTNSGGDFSFYHPEDEETVQGKKAEDDTATQEGTSGGERTDEAGNKPEEEETDLPDPDFEGAVGK